LGIRIVQVFCDGSLRIARVTEKAIGSQRLHRVCGDTGNSDDREERIDQFGGEGFEFGGACGAGGKLIFLADEPVAVGLNRTGAEATGDQVGRLAIESETLGAGRSEKSAAIPFSDADVAFIHGKGDHLETTSLETSQNVQLLGSEFHIEVRITASA
jgi:hypothetical protein